MPARYVPDDFPRKPDPGAVPGVQPKLLVQEVRGRFQSGLTEEELWFRYDVREDLAAQLAAQQMSRLMVVKPPSLASSWLREQQFDQHAQRPTTAGQLGRQGR
mgnify:CR=1 FL=1